MRVLSAALLLLACAAPPNHLPALDNTKVSLNQGEATTVQLATSDPDGDHVTVQIVSAPQGLNASLGDDGVTLSLRADYTLSGVQTVSLQLDDHVGGTTRVDLDVELSALAWQWNESFTTGPVAREHGTFVYDPGHDVAYLIGGSGYAPQGAPAMDGNWTLDLKTHAFTALTASGIAPKPAASRRAVNFPERKTAYLFGGYDSATTDINELISLDYSGATPVFATVSQVNAPAARELHVFSYDPGTDTFVLFGGVNNTPAVFNDTWTMKLVDGVATWTKLSLSGPSGRYGSFFGMDENTGHLWVWSGAQYPTGSDTVNAAKDLWMLDMRASPQPNWVRVLAGTEDGAAKGRRNGGCVWDPHGPRMFVFGGTADAATTVPGLSVLDFGASTPTWTTMDLANAPPLRSSDFGFYDVARSQVVIGFGNGNKVYRDVFALGY